MRPAWRWSPASCLPAIVFPSVLGGRRVVHSRRAGSSRRRSLLPRELVLDHYRSLFGNRDFWTPIRNSLIVAGATTFVSVVARRDVRVCARAAAVSREVVDAGVRPGGLDVPADLHRVAAVHAAAGAGPDQHVSRPGAALSDIRHAAHDLAARRVLPPAARRTSKKRRSWTAPAGCSVLARIVLPLSWPGLATTAILTFLYSWNEFLFALSFTLGPERYTVPVAITLFRGQYQVPWGEILAAAVVATLPVAAIVLAGAAAHRRRAHLRRREGVTWLRLRWSRSARSIRTATVAVRDLTLEIADGELLVIVGPSGSGKSTALRLIAGLEAPTAGQIRIGGRDVTGVAPQDRDLAMVFQSYALYPHKSVRENLAFGLRVRRVDPARIDERVASVADAARHRCAARSEAGAAVRRPAPARGARPRDRARAQGVPARRAAVESRPAPARRHARRAGAPAPAAGHDDGATSRMIRRRR